MAPNGMFVATILVALYWSITIITNVHEIALVQHPPKWAGPTNHELDPMPSKLIVVNHLKDGHSPKDK
jgi:hypothetical protein